VIGRAREKWGEVPVAAVAVAGTGICPATRLAKSRKPNCGPDTAEKTRLTRTKVPLRQRFLLRRKTINGQGRLC